MAYPFKPTERNVFMLLLNIQSSPRGAKSASIAVTNAFLDAYQALHPDATIDTLNVWEENLPDFDSEAIGAKYKGVSHKPMTAAEAFEIWERIQSLAKRFPTCGPHRARRSDVELRLSLQAETIDRPRLST